MAEFVVKLKDESNVRSFLRKLDLNFNKINSKNILLDRSLTTHTNKKNIYAIVEITPKIPNVPLYACLFSWGLFIALALILERLLPFLLISGLILYFLSLFWSKYFFYLLFSRSLRKNNIKKMELI